MFWTQDRIRLMFRYPDKPMQATLNKLKTLDSKNDYLCEQKIDGYRYLIFIEPGRVCGLSRHRKPLPVSQSILNRILDINIPMPAVLDSEWVKLRGGQQESFYLLDSMYIGGEWVGSQNLYERRAFYINQELPNGFNIPISTTIEFINFLADQIEDIEPSKTISEGVVVKKIHTKLVGSRIKSAENSNWIKVKWRAGEGGDTILLTKTGLESYVNNNL